MLQTTQIISDVCFITDHVAYASQIKPKSFESRWNSSSFFTRGGCASCLGVCLGARLLPQSYQYPKGADRVGGQLRGDKECPFSGVTKSGRVWRKLPESDARSVQPIMTGCLSTCDHHDLNRYTVDWHFPQCSVGHLRAVSQDKVGEWVFHHDGFHVPV